MKLFRPAVLALLLSVGLPALASDGSGDPRYTIQNPPAFAMIGDLLIARPLLLAATVIGAGAFVVSLPFTALGGGVGDGRQGAGGGPGEVHVCAVPGVYWGGVSSGRSDAFGAADGRSRASSLPQGSMECLAPFFAARRKSPLWERAWRRDERR